MGGRKKQDEGMIGWGEVEEEYRVEQMQVKPFFCGRLLVYFIHTTLHSIYAWPGSRQDDIVRPDSSCGCSPFVQRGFVKIEISFLYSDGVFRADYE